MRFCLCLVALTALSFAAEGPKSDTVRGKLVIREGQPAAIETSEHKLIKLDGDDPTRKVLTDKRLNGFDTEAKGHFTAPDRFVIDPIHTHAMLVHKDGHTKLVSYWCDVCTIRSYTPGPCVCCQKETALDLIDPDHQDHQ
jgi:hypothetical protein